MYLQINFQRTEITCFQLVQCVFHLYSQRPKLLKSTKKLKEPLRKAVIFPTCLGPGRFFFKHTPKHSNASGKTSHKCAKLIKLGQ